MLLGVCWCSSATVLCSSFWCLAKLTVFRLSVGCRQVGDFKGNTMSALYMAARGGHLECVEQLLGGGVDANKGCVAGKFANATPLYIASQKGHEETYTQF